MTQLLLKARDPVISRDGRPFGETQGRRMNSLDWPLPSTFAGAVRTGLGKLREEGFTEQTCEELEQLGVSGPFPLVEREIYLPAPEDLVRDAEGSCHPRRPSAFGDHEGSDLPEGLRPVLCRDGLEPDDKQPPPPTWWSTSALGEWLTMVGETKLDLLTDPYRFLVAPARDERTHVRIDPGSRTASDGLLFSTTGLVLDAMQRPGSEECNVPIGLSLKIDPVGSFSGELESVDWLQPVGGERRLVHFAQSPPELARAWQCPTEVVNSLMAEAERPGTKRIRMILASPAVFRHGWRPHWLAWDAGKSSYVGTPPGGSGRLQLVGVANRRWQAVSGYSLASTSTTKVGPKPIRRLTPAGSVYFFETDDDPSWLPNHWLRPVNDDCYDHTANTSGFGLAIWGTWSPFAEARDSYSGRRA